MNTPKKNGFHLDDKKKNKQKKAVIAATIYKKIFKPIDLGQPTVHYHTETDMTDRRARMSLHSTGLLLNSLVSSLLDITRVCSFWVSLSLFWLFLFLLLLCTLRNLHVKRVCLEHHPCTEQTNAVLTTRTHHVTSQNLLTSVSSSAGASAAASSASFSFFSFFFFFFSFLLSSSVLDVSWAAAAASLSLPLSSRFL